MKVTKVVTLNSVEINQVILDFASLVNQIESVIKNKDVCTPADLENYIGILKTKNTNTNISTYDVVSDFNVVTYIEVEH